MTDDNEIRLSDEELEAFLAGKHDVNAAHDSLEKAVTPGALDERILARAGEEAGKETDKADPVKTRSGDIDVFIRRYAVAATVLVCLSIALVLVRENSGPAAGDASPLESTARQRTIPVTPVQPEESAQSARAFSESAGEDQAAHETAVTGAQLRARAPEVSNIPDQAAAKAAEDAEGRSALQETDSTAVEEISVTGALRTGAPEYRNDREQWLREIRRLRDGGQDGEADREVQLFLQAYPGTDIDAALEALE